MPFWNLINPLPVYYMAWSSDIDTIVETSRDITASYLLHILNGYDAIEEEDHTIIRVQNDGWSISLVEGAPTISTLRLKPGYSDFEYFDEFDHSNPFQIFSDCMLECIIYKSTTTALAGTIILSEGLNIVQGLGTTFLTDLAPGDIVLVTGYETHPIMVRDVVNNFLFEAYQNSWVTIPAPGVGYSIRDREREYIYRGLIEDKQLQNMDLGAESFDYLIKLNWSNVILDMEADRLGPYTNATLRHAPAFDPTGPTEYYTFEVDPTAPGQSWAEDIFGNNRAFADGVFVIEQLIAAVWTVVTPSEYMIDAPYGIIRFHNDQGGPPPSFRIQSLEVYQEGTLELADVYETILRYPNACPDLGPGFGDDQLQIEFPVGQTIQYVAGGPPYVVNGIGTDFQGDLEIGDRIAFLATPLDFGIVEWIAPAAQTLHLKYPKAAAGPARWVKSTLKESEVSMSTLRWKECQGTAADLVRKLRDYYADSKGYRIYYDPFEDKIRGKRVAIDIANARTLGPKTNLRTSATAENFASAVLVKYAVGRAKNLITAPGTTITDVSRSLPLVGLNPWLLGTSPLGWNGWGGMIWPIFEPPPAVEVIADTRLDMAYMVYRNEEKTDPDYPLDENWYQLLHIDLGAEYALEQIDVYAPNCKNPEKYNSGISIHKSAALAGFPVADLGPLIPETYHRDIAPDEHIAFNCTTAAKVQYLVVIMRPVKYAASGGSRSMGLREMIIFGAADACETVCIQGDKAPGSISNLTGNITFNAGGPPYTVTGVGTLFIAELAVGDAICIDTDTEYFGFVRNITDNLNLQLLLPYGGTPGAGGALRIADDPFNPTTCVEGQGGHFIGGSSLDADFITDYYPKLIAKMYHTGHRMYTDDSGIVFSEAQAIDRGYLMLNEMIRLYREILWKGAFDPRFLVYDTAYTDDAYRETGAEDLNFMVEAIHLNEAGVTISGREYGAGVFE